MNPNSVSVIFYPYLYQYEAMILTILMVSIVGSLVFGIYKLVIFKMNDKLKKVFHGYLKIAVIAVIILFLVEVLISIYTIQLVNKQLGFNYATPETQEGELFEITGVVRGKAMGKAGLKLGDQIQMSNVDELYRLLINNQGKEVEVSVLRKRQRVKIKINIPDLDVPLAKLSFLF